MPQIYAVKNKVKRLKDPYAIKDNIHMHTYARTHKRAHTHTYTHTTILSDKTTEIRVRPA